MKRTIARLYTQLNYICMTPMKPAKNNLSLINLTTGISDGLILPFASCIVAYPYFIEHPWKLFGIGIVIAVAGALVFGLARFLGEREEIKHNHPQMAAAEARKETELMTAIGIDKELTLEMQLQMEQERALWLKEVQENDMGWEQYDNKRAVRSGLQTSLGFLSGGVLVCSPFVFFIQDVAISLIIPCIFYLVLLFVFGWVKGKLINANNPLRAAIYKSGKGFIVLILALVVSLFIYLREDEILDPNNVYGVKFGLDITP